MTNNSDLLKLIEKEMMEDIAKINVKDSEVTLEVVKDWYIETEKLVRTLANLLPATMAQPINQLRYAGHHIIKISPLSGEKPTEEEHSNIVEAYKHCKRAYYDSLDLYVYHLGDVFKTKLAVLPNNKDVTFLTTEIKKHLDSHIKDREKSDTRLEYYKKINDTLHDGLGLIAKVDGLCRNYNIHDSMLVDRQQLVADKESAVQERDFYHDELNIKMARQEKKIAGWGMFATGIIVLSGLFQGYLTQKFVTPSSRTEVTMLPVISNISQNKNPDILKDTKDKAVVLDSQKLDKPEIQINKKATIKK